MTTINIGLLKECIKDWESGILTDWCAMFIVKMIVYPTIITDKDVEMAKAWAKEYFDKK
jgi:hypothetical protein